MIIRSSKALKKYNIVPITAQEEVKILNNENVQKQKKKKKSTPVVEEPVVEKIETIEEKDEMEDLSKWLEKELLKEEIED